MEGDPTTAAAVDEEVKMKLSELEKENYVLKEQLEESKQNVEKINKENEDLKAANQAFEKSALEKSNNYLLIEKERGTLLVDKMRYQTENAALKNQKELLEAQTTRLLAEKRSLSEDIQSLKDDHQKALQKIAKLQTDIDDFQSEKALLQHDKERWAQEKELYAKTREWYMNELAERDRTVSSLRLQIVQLERDVMLKKAELDNAVDDFTLKNETLSAKLEDLENECKELREKNMEFSNENRVVVENISAELQVKERLIATYKEEMESLKSELENYKTDEGHLREALAEKEAALIQTSEENKKISEEAQDQVADRESKIHQLQEELDKANELLKFGTVGLPGSNVSAFSASAAELLSSGTSLSSIYAQHSKVLAELAEEKQKQKDLEEYVKCLLEDLRKNAPNVLQIRKENDTLNIENRELRQQLKHTFGERDKLRSEADNIGRELKFTRTELLSAQRENSTLKKQVQKLLYVAENEGAEVDMNVSQNDEAVFSNIRELHEQNIDLINQLEELKHSTEESVKQAKQEEIDKLEQKLSEFSHEVAMLQDSQDKTAFIIEQLEKQRDAYKEELENRHRSPLKPLNASSRSFGVAAEPDSSTAASNEWKTKCEKLEEKLRYIVNDKQKTEEALNNRVDAQMELISQLRLTNGRIESDLEYQKKNQETAFKKVNEFEKEISKKNEQIAKFKAQMESDSQKINKLTNELHLKVDEMTKLNVNYQLLNEKYDVARNNAVSYEAQLKVLRESRYSAERMNLTLEGLESLLKLNEKEKLEQMKSQLDVVTIERDNYKSAVEELRSNAERRSMELQATLGEAVAAKEKIQIEMKYQREQYSILEQLLEKIKAENAELAKKMNEFKSSDLSVDGLNKEIHQMRNKNLYYEKQLADQRLQYDQLKARFDSKEKELMELKRLTGNFESTMKSQDEQQQMTQAQLQQQCNDLSIELEHCKGTIEDLNAKLSEAEARDNNHGQEMDAIRQSYNSQIAELQQTLSENQAQLERKNQEVTNLIASLQTAQAERDNVDSRVKLLDDQLVNANNQIAELKMELKAQKERFENASTEHDAIVSRLRNSVVLLEKEKARLNEELKDLQSRDHEQKLSMDTLYDKIQALTQDTLLNSQLDTSSASMNTSVSGDSSLTTVVEILRKIKDKEMEMRMAAEIELSRVKAQAHIDEQKIQELSNQVEELQKQVQINVQLVSEKNELVNRLGSLQAVQRRNEELQQELASAQQKATGLEQMNRRLNAELAKISKTRDAAQTQFSSVNQQLAETKKQLEELRTRSAEMEKQLAQGGGGTAAGSSSAEDSQKIAAELAKLKESNGQIKSLARKYRDESAAHVRTIAELKAKITTLEAQVKQAQDEAAAAAATASALPQNVPLRMQKIMSTKLNEINTLKTEIASKQNEMNNFRAEIATLNERIQALNQENEATKKQLEEAQKKINESAEMNMRVKSLTTAFESMKSKTEQQDLELKKLRAEKDNAVEALQAASAAANVAAVGNSSQSRKRSLQEYSLEDVSFEQNILAHAKKSRLELDDQFMEEEKEPEVAAPEEAADLLGEQSNDIVVPSVQHQQQVQVEDQEEEGHMDEDFVPEENDNSNEMQQFEDSELPAYPQEEEEEEGGAEDDDENAFGEEDFDEEDQDIDDEDADAHSQDPDEGDVYNDEGSDDDVVVIN